MALADLQIKVTRSVKVLPAEPRESSTMFLNNIDQEAMYKVETIYCFPPNPSKSSTSVAEVIEAALSKVLVPYYFLAGRFRADTQDQRIEVDCNGAGVLFAAAESKLQLSELGDISVPTPAFRSFLLQPSQSLGLFETPFATFQVTRFSCGGFVLGMTIFHSMMDGNAIIGFLFNLCSIARGEGFVLQPNPNRENLKARSPPRPEYYEQLMCKTFRVSKFSEIPLLSFNPTMTSINNSAPTQRVFKSFPVSGQMVLALKSQALKDGGLAKCSSFEVIVSHVLQQLSRSKTSLDPATLLPVFIAVDISKKMEPPLEKNFCGNGVVAACIAATIEELRTRSLSSITGFIQESIAEINDEYVRSWTDFWQIKRIGPARIPMGACFSGWWKLPFYDIDFGWGKPVFAGPVPNQLDSFILILSNGTRDGGGKVYICLEPQEMVEFEKNFYS